jgi:3'(2'), 5'-bisphosphate nucleotidase
VATSRSHLDARTVTLLQRIGEHAPVGLGSSLKFCLLAEGEADLYPRFAPTSQWDTAAAQAVLEGAGGQVLGLDGQRFHYPQRSDWLNPYFIATGQPDESLRRLLLN